MIVRFGKDKVLSLVDVQKGVDEFRHSGGVRGRRDRPDLDRAGQCIAAQTRGRLTGRRAWSCPSGAY